MKVLFYAHEIREKTRKKNEKILKIFRGLSRISRA